MYEGNIKKIVSGMSKEDVEIILGPKTIAGSFDENIWYYIYRKYEQSLSFNDKRFLEGKVLAITFLNNKVKNIKLFTSNKEIEFPYIKKTTAINLSKKPVIVNQPNKNENIYLLK